MKTLCVYADFDWLKETELVGELGYESLRGSDSYCFTFSDEWLKKHGDLFLCERPINYPGQQYTQPVIEIFGCFSVVASGADWCVGREATGTETVFFRFFDWYR